MLLASFPGTWPGNEAKVLHAPGRRKRFIKNSWALEKTYKDAALVST